MEAYRGVMRSMGSCSTNVALKIKKVLPNAKAVLVKDGPSLNVRVPPSGPLKNAAMRPWKRVKSQQNLAGKLMAVGKQFDGRNAVSAVPKINPELLLSNRQANYEAPLTYRCNYIDKYKPQIYHKNLYNKALEQNKRLNGHFCDGLMPIDKDVRKSIAQNAYRNVEIKEVHAMARDEGRIPSDTKPPAAKAIQLPRPRFGYAVVNKVKADPALTADLMPVNDDLKELLSGNYKAKLLARKKMLSMGIKTTELKPPASDVADSMYQRYNNRSATSFGAAVARKAPLAPISLGKLMPMPTAKKMDEKPLNYAQPSLLDKHVNVESALAKDKPQHSQQLKVAPLILPKNRGDESCMRMRYAHLQTNQKVAELSKRMMSLVPEDVLHAAAGKQK